MVSEILLDIFDDKTVSDIVIKTWYLRCFFVHNEVTVRVAPARVSVNVLGAVDFVAGCFGGSLSLLTVQAWGVAC